VAHRIDAGRAARRPFGPVLEHRLTVDRVLLPLQGFEELIGQLHRVDRQPLPRPRRRPGRALADDPGRFAVTGDEADRGAFRTPTLRNVTLTAPYMHDAVLATLEDVIGFYDTGGGTVPGRSGPEIGPLRLSPQERQALVAFLQSLTDPTADTRVPAVP
jgi:cytochrome c peroxidase